MQGISREMLKRPDAASQETRLHMLLKHQPELPTESISRYALHQRIGNQIPQTPQAGERSPPRHQPAALTAKQPAQRRSMRQGIGRVPSAAFHRIHRIARLQLLQHLLHRAAGKTAEVGKLLNRSRCVQQVHDDICPSRNAVHPPHPQQECGGRIRQRPAQLVAIFKRAAQQPVSRCQFIPLPTIDRRLSPGMQKHGPQPGGSTSLLLRRALPAFVPGLRAQGGQVRQRSAISPMHLAHQRLQPRRVHQQAIFHQPACRQVKQALVISAEHRRSNQQSLRIQNLCIICRRHLRSHAQTAPLPPEQPEHRIQKRCFIFCC